MWIFWKQWSVQISADHVFVKHTFCAIFSIISMTIKYSSEGAVFSNVSSSTMVFKSDNRMLKGIILKYDIVNQTWASLFGIEVNKGKTFDSSLILSR